MRRKIKLLAFNCLIRGKLDAQKIKKIVPFLNKVELRQFIIFLKQLRKKEKITVETPLAPVTIWASFVPFLKKKFKNKEIELLENKELIGGLKIRVEDNTLDLSVKGIFDKFNSYL